MDLSIIIVNYNVYEDVKACIASIYNFFKRTKFEIIVVDNCSSDKSILDINGEFSNVRLIPLDTNNGFGAANNIGMIEAKGKIFFLVNPDIVFQDNSAEDMYEFLTNNSEVGVMGPVQIKPGKGIEYYYSFFPSLYSRFAQEFGFYMTAPLIKSRFFAFWDKNIAAGIPFKVDWVIGSSMMLKREIFQLTGGFDEAFFLYEEETEWQYRINKNDWSSMIFPGSKVLHNHHSSSGKIGRLFIHFHEFRSRIIFSNKHDNLLKRSIRKLMILNALILRIVFNSFRLILTGNRGSLKKIKVFFVLIKFNLKSRSKIMNNRFVFDDYKFLFNA